MYVVNYFTVSKIAYYSCFANADVGLTELTQMLIIIIVVTNSICFNC